MTRSKRIQRKRAQKDNEPIALPAASWLRRVYHQPFQQNRRVDRVAHHVSALFLTHSLVVHWIYAALPQTYCDISSWKCIARSQFPMNESLQHLRYAYISTARFMFYYTRPSQRWENTNPHFLRETAFSDRQSSPFPPGNLRRQPTDLYRSWQSTDTRTAPTQTVETNTKNSAKLNKSPQ